MGTDVHLTHILSSLNDGKLSLLELVPVLVIPVTLKCVHSKLNSGIKFAAPSTVQNSERLVPAVKLWPSAVEKIRTAISGSVNKECMMIKGHIIWV